MSDPLSQVGKKLLCLYSIYGDITEAKLTFLRGYRSYEDFQQYALEFVFNVSAQISPTSREEIFGNFFDYMRSLQNDYRIELLERGLAETELLSPIVDAEPSWEILQRVHHSLCSADGTAPADYEIKQLMDGADVGWEFEGLKAFTEGLEAARQAYIQIDEFHQRCDNSSIRLFHNPQQTMAEFSMFLTHIARGFRYKIDGNIQKADDERKAALSHLKRITLDMRKSIILTVMRHRPQLIGHDLLRALLKCRQKELSLPVEDGEKFNIYQDEVKTVLELDIFS